METYIGGALIGATLVTLIWLWCALRATAERERAYRVAQIMAIVEYDGIATEMPVEVQEKRNAR